MINDSVIVQLKGGLGNQMFQYAAGRSLAIRLNLPLKLDISAFQNEVSERKYVLDNFNITSDLVTQKEIEWLRKLKKRKANSNRVKAFVKNKIIPPHRRVIINQRGSSYANYFDKIKRGCYLDGYWQSERYFYSVRNIIRDEFSIKYPDPPLFNKNLAQLISDSESVSVHIRRGDYLANQRVHFVLPFDYYKKAIDFLHSTFNNLKYFIFSDDIDWVKENWELDFDPIYVNHKGPNSDIKEFQLMRGCKHHIIANSTFSWWAAWLCDNPSKSVIAPEQWFSKEEMEKRGEIDIIPERWAVL